MGFLITLQLFISSPNLQKTRSAKSRSLSSAASLVHRTSLDLSQCVVKTLKLSGIHSVKDAKKYLDKYKRPDIAIDAFYSDGGVGFASSSTFARKGDTASMVLKLNQLFDKYKGVYAMFLLYILSDKCSLTLADAEGDDITVVGTIKLCEDLEVDPEDVVLLAVAYELKSPRVGEWSRRGWVDGWKSLSCDSVTSMRTCLQKLRDRLSSDQAYFKSVYNYTFDFARTQGQRSLAVDTAIAFWSLLLPHGLKGKALSCVDLAADSDSEDEDEDGDVDMDNNIRERGWKEEYNDLWFEFLNVKGGRGVSKDTWTMVRIYSKQLDQ